MDLRVATANIAGWLGRGEAAESLATVLDAGPDLIGVQEWRPTRRGLLREHSGLAWRSPLLGGCVVGWRRDRFTGMRGRALPLSLPGVGVREGGLWEPGRVATLVQGTDRASGREVCLLSFHLVYGVQAAGRYRADRPRLVARHRAEVRRLGAAVGRRLERGVQVFAVGDSNFHGLALPPLVSAWTGRPGEGTLGAHRQVDDVFALRPPDDVALLTTTSDHRAVVATWADQGSSS